MAPPVGSPLFCLMRGDEMNTPSSGGPSAALMLKGVDMPLGCWIEEQEVPVGRGEEGGREGRELQVTIKKEWECD